MKSSWKARALAAIAAVGLLTVGAAPAAQAADNTPHATAASHQWLTGYWHNFNNGSTLLKLSEVPSAYNLVAVAFAESHPTLSGGIKFTLESAELGGYSQAQFKADIKSLQAQGRKVIISVGGEKAHVSVTSASDAKNFADTAYAIMNEYGFDGIDIDLEHGVNADAMSTALHDLRARVGSNLIITMAPQTIDYQATTMPYYQLTQKIKDILTIVNVQYYNSGSMLGCDQKVYSQGTPQFAAALACIQLEMGLRPDQVGLGFPSVQKAAGGGYMSTADVIKAVNSLENGTAIGGFTPPRAYGKIGGVMTWSINWDATNGYAFAQALANRLDTGGEWVPPTDPVDPDPTDPENPDPVDPDPVDPDPVDPGTATCDGVALWNAQSIYTGGNRAIYQGAVYEAKWWTQGANPSLDAAWKLIKQCGNSETPGGPGTSPATCPAWIDGKVYVGGDKVTYAGATYTAKWWTNSDVPGAAQYGPWEKTGSCS